MARTHFFARVARALRTAAFLEARRISTPEGIERRDAFLHSRRRFLQHAGLAAGALTLAACGPGTTTGDGGLDGMRPDTSPTPDVTNDTADASSNGPRIVVIGAGLAGLTAAYRLTMAGYEVQVFDANDRIGGRTFTERTRFVCKVELGGELIDTGHDALRNLAGELGLTVLNQAAAVSTLELERYRAGGMTYTEAQMIDLFRPVSAILLQDWMDQGGMDAFASYDMFSPAQQTLDQLSIAAWMDMHGISGPIRTILDAAYQGEYGRNIDQQSYLNLLYLIDPGTDAFKLFGVSDEVFTIQEGNDAVASALAGRLRRPVELNAALVALRPGPGSGVTAVLQTGATMNEVVADRIVLALPFSTLRNVDIQITLPPQKTRAIMELGYGLNAKLMVQTNTRIWETMGSTGTTFADTIYNESWSSSRGYPGTQGVMTGFYGGDRGVSVGQATPDEQATFFLTKLEEVFRGITNEYAGVVARFHWPTAQWFQGSYACYLPGQWTSISGAEAEQVGVVHFAGEHTSVDYQGFMNGAVESGERAAMEVMSAG